VGTRRITNSKTDAAVKPTYDNQQNTTETEEWLQSKEGNTTEESSGVYFPLCQNITHATSGVEFKGIRNIETGYRRGNKKRKRVQTKDDVI